MPKFWLNQAILAKVSTLEYNVLTMETVISIKNLSKTYKNGVHALKNINLDIYKGEVFGLLGENGAGKTTMIGIICGLVNKTEGTVTVMGKDVVKDYRFTRKKIGLVPQEVKLDIFMKVKDSVRYARGFYGLKRDDAFVEKVLKSLALWEHKEKQARELSGGMMRRLLIAKALVHEPEILFLDEPTAGVDVNLRRGLWDLVRELNQKGMTTILTTHYIEEAEQMADRIGIIVKGELKVVEEKVKLMEKLGEKKIELSLADTLDTLPSDMNGFELSLGKDKKTLTYIYSKETGRIQELLEKLLEKNIKVVDIKTSETSLEEIFLNLTKQ